MKSGIAKTGFCVAIAFSLGGCQQYLARQDLISPSTGNAVAQNLALQTPDPWPPYVYDNDIRTSGQRQGDAYVKYETKHAESEEEALTPLQLVVPSQ